MVSNLIDILTLLLEEYNTHSKIELEKLNEIDNTLINIRDLLLKSVEGTQKLNEKISQVQDDIIELKYR